MRWEPGVRSCRHLLSEGALGAAYDIAFHVYVDTPWHLWGWLSEKETIEVLYHSIHYLDSIRYLTGLEPHRLYKRQSATRLCGAGRNAHLHAFDVCRRPTGNRPVQSSR